MHDLPTVHVPASIALASALRRRVWRIGFASPQVVLGSFFLDPRDHIGAERLILGGFYERYVLSVLEALIVRLELGDGIAVDIGANIGNHSRWFLDRFDWVECVEPGRIAGLVLEANLLASERSNWTLHRCALGREKGFGTLLETGEHNLGGSMLRESPSGEIPIRTGDSLWGARFHKGMPLKLVKIDVEGSETEVVHGMRAILAQHKPVVCVEVLTQSSWTLLHPELTSLGYTNFFVIEEIPRSRLLARWTPFVMGRQWALRPMPTGFRERGYEMVVCLSPAHLAKLGGNDTSMTPSPSV